MYYIVHTNAALLVHTGEIDRGLNTNCT